MKICFFHLLRIFFMISFFLSGGPAGVAILLGDRVELGH